MVGAKQKNNQPYPFERHLIRRLDPGYVKAYYRRGSANMALAKYKEAVRDFKRVRTLFTVGRHLQLRCL